ncbi:MAG TPA: DUF6059 family protein [Jatrophihabitans sp.]|nr:DUF6059 family protein [Jatrophihabitans sp.]
MNSAIRRSAWWRLLGRAIRLTGRYLYLGLIAFGAAMSGTVGYQQILRELLALHGKSGDERASGPADERATIQPAAAQPPGHPERPAGHLPPTAEERALWLQLY